MTEDNKQKDTVKFEARSATDPNILTAAREHVETVSVELEKGAAFNRETLVYLIYMFYKCNLLQRNNLREMFTMIKEDKTPENIAEWLVKEAAKA